MFTARGGRPVYLEHTGGGSDCEGRDLEARRQRRQSVSQGQVIGFGLPSTICDPASDRLGVLRAGGRLQLGGRGLG
ncbi:MAG: hypothetical protein VKO39_10095 [Cyanobacteriota bacterium]|nr:hypothetical protein [Cyanobacteriota bacterium]